MNSDGDFYDGDGNSASGDYGKLKTIFQVTEY
jgi:hypothetical protein